MEKNEIFEVVVNYIFGALGDRERSNLPRKERTIFVIMATPRQGSCFLQDGSEAFSRVQKILMAESEENVKMHLSPYEDVRIQSIRQVARDAETIIVGF